MEKIVDIDEITPEEYVFWREINNWNANLVFDLRRQGFKVGIRGTDAKIHPLPLGVIHVNDTYLLSNLMLEELPKEVLTHSYNPTHVRFLEQRLFISVIGDNPFTLEETINDYLIAYLNTEINIYAHSFVHWINRFKKSCSTEKLDEFKTFVNVRNVAHDLPVEVVMLETLPHKGKYFESDASLQVIDVDKFDSIFLSFIQFGFYYLSGHVNNTFYHTKDEYDELLSL